MSIVLMDFLHNCDGRTDVGRSRDAIASKKVIYVYLGMSVIEGER